MLIYEYRIPMPMTIGEYEIGQHYAVAEMSLRETGGGEGVEVMVNEPFKDQPLRLPGFSSGIYTHKIYHLESKLPAIVRLLASPGRFDLHENAWNAYPYCKTVISNPGFMKERFVIDIESLHVDKDTGDVPNALQLTDEELKIRKVYYIDIGNDPFTGKSDMEFDPSTYVSQKAKRGPLRGNWIKEMKPMMTVYKVVRAEFRYFGLQRKIESLIMVNELRLFTNFHRRLFCWMDSWYGLHKQDVVKIEQQFYEKLKTKINTGSPASSFNTSELYESQSSCITQHGKIFKQVNRRLFCWMDNWYDYSLEEIKILANNKMKKLRAKMKSTENSTSTI